MVKQTLTVVLLAAFVISCTIRNPTETLPPSSPAIESIRSPMLALSPSTAVRPSPTPIDNAPVLVFYVSEQGKYEAWLPVSESIMEYTIPQRLFEQSIECAITVSRLNGASAAVQYCDLASEDIALQSVNAILEEFRDAMKRDFRWKIEKEQIKTIQTYPALLLSGQENMRGLGYDGVFKAHIVLVKNRVYFVQMSVYSDNWCNCLHQMDQVLDTFYVEPEMSIPFEPTP